MYGASYVTIYVKNVHDERIMASTSSSPIVSESKLPVLFNIGNRFLK